jgi:hypothetical protein
MDIILYTEDSQRSQTCSGGNINMLFFSSCWCFFAIGDYITNFPDYLLTYIIYWELDGNYGWYGYWCSGLAWVDSD